MCAARVSWVSTRGAHYREALPMDLPQPTQLQKIHGGKADRKHRLRFSNDAFGERASIFDSASRGDICAFILVPFATGSAIHRRVLEESAKGQRETEEASDRTTQTSG